MQIKYLGGREEVEEEGRWWWWGGVTLLSWDLVIYRLLVSVADVFFVFFPPLSEILIRAQHFVNIYPSVGRGGLRVSKGRGKKWPQYQFRL